MKCIVHNADKPEGGLPVIVLRVYDEVAYQRCDVPPRTWHYVSKEFWKQNKKDWAAIKEIK